MLHYVKTDAGESRAYGDGEEVNFVGNEIYRATWDASSPTVTVLIGEPGPVEIDAMGWPQFGVLP